MAENKEARERIEDALGQVQMFTSVASENQVRSVMRVLAECSLAVGGELRDAAEEIRSFNKSMTAFNDSTAKLSGRVVVLNWLLLAAAVVAAVATAVGAWATVHQAVK